MADTILTATRLREVLRYDLYTGIFTRLCGPRKGRTAGWDHGQGYLRITMDGKEYRAHRLAFLYVTGSWPKHEIDHINGIRSDNSWINLRQLTGAENTQNQRKPHKNGSSGFLGVSPRNGKFIAQIRVNTKRIYLGVFDAPEIAYAAYVTAKRKLHRSSTI